MQGSYSPTTTTARHCFHVRVSRYDKNAFSDQNAMQCRGEAAALASLYPHDRIAHGSMVCCVPPLGHSLRYHLNRLHIPYPSVGSRLQTTSSG